MSYDDSIDRVSELWAGGGSSWGRERYTHWIEHPRVRERISRKITGRDGSEPYHHFVHEELKGRLPVDRALTLGCGVGELERGLVQYDFCRHHDAFDVSAGAIETAKQQATALGYSHIHYAVQDLNQFRLPVDTYDVVFGVSAVHHTANLEDLYDNVLGALKPGGYFYMDEFIGPTQFQWKDRQLEAVNAFLRGIPERLRVSVTDGTTVHETVVRHTIEHMNNIDPSEAIRSEEILGLLPRYFADYSVRGYGGTVLHLLMEDIAGNFVDADPEAMEWLKKMFAYEDELIGSGELSDDFAVILARKP